MHLLSGAVEEFDGLSNLEEATQRYQRYKVNSNISCMSGLIRTNSKLNRCTFRIYFKALKFYLYYYL